MRLLLSLALLAAFAAPAAAQRGGLAQCTPARDAAEAREIAELKREVRQAILAELPGDTSGHVVFEVDAATQSTRVLFVDVSAGEALRQRVTERFVKHLGRVLEPRTLHFRVAPRPAEAEDGGCAARGREPGLANTGWVAEELARVEREYRARKGKQGAQGRVVVKMLVTAEGRPALVLLQDHSGDEWLDRRLGEVAQGMRFGAREVDAWVELPLSLSRRG